MEARNEVTRQVREGGAADGAKSEPLGGTCTQGSSSSGGDTCSEATPFFGACSGATPTDSGGCSADSTPCNDTSAAICQTMWKLATKNRPHGHAPCSNETTPTLPSASNEAPPILSSGGCKGFKNRPERKNQGSGSAHEERDRREEDTGQLDQSDRSDQGEGQEEGPISHER